MQSPTMKNLCVFPFSYLLPWNVEGVWGCAGSLLLHVDFLELWQARAPLCCRAQASRGVGFARYRAQALGEWASVAAASGLGRRDHFTALQPVVSSRTRDGTCVLCTARRILIHCTTSQGRKASWEPSPRKVFISYLISFNWQRLPHADFVSPSFLFPSPSSLCPGVICKQVQLPMTRHLNLSAMDCW